MSSNDTVTLSGTSAKGSHISVSVAWEVPDGTSTPPQPPTPPTPTPAPGRVVEVWLMEWSSSHSPMAYALPAGMNVLNLAFLQGNGQPVGWGSETQTQLVGDLRTLKARKGGCSVLAGIGGSGGNVDLSNTTTFVHDVMAYRQQLGGQLDGIVWDVEASTLDVSAAFEISTALHEQVPGFQIVCCPNGGNVDLYLTLATRLQAAGLLTRYGQQYYDAVVSEGAVESRLRQSVGAGIPIEKTTIGMMIGTDDHHWTLPQCVANMTTVKQHYPTIGGAFLWEAGRDHTAEWASAMAGLLG